MYITKLLNAQKCTIEKFYIKQFDQFQATKKDTFA